MPHYDYQCRTCGKQFEFFQSISSEAFAHCPESVCEQPIKGKGIVERRISKGAGLIFHGSGFYLTDYVKKNSPSEVTGKSDKAEASPNTGTSTPTKPETT